MERAIISILQNASDVTTIVGAVSNDRIYIGSLPQDIDLPAITIMRVDTEPTQTKDGASDLDVGRFDIDMWGLNDMVGEVHDLADKVRTALERTTGTHDTIVVQSITFRDQRSFHESIPEMPRYRIQQEYTLRHNTAT